MALDGNANSFSGRQTMNRETSSGSASPNAFFEHPILNSPYECPPRHWELDEAGQPTQKIIERRRSAKFITPIPKPKKRKAAPQPGFVFDEGLGLSTSAKLTIPPRSSTKFAVTLTDGGGCATPINGR